MINENQNQGELEKNIINIMRMREQIKNLQQAIGQKIRIDYVWYGSQYSDERILKGVNDYINLRIENIVIPFVGYGSAIQRITDEKGNILYENLNISDNYDVRNLTERVDLIARTFGQDIANKIRDERIKSNGDFKENKKGTDK